MSQKQPLKVLLIFGFNMMVGYAFLIALSTAYGSVGNWLPFMVIFCAAIAFAVGLAFAKLSNKIKGYGGSYLYVKRAFGSFWANLTGWFQYAQAPAISLGVISGIVWATQQTPNNFIPKYATPYIFLAAGILYILISSILYFGLTSTKITLIVLWVLKWGVLLLSIIFALILFGINFHNSNNNFIHNIFNNGYIVPKGQENLTDIVIGTSSFFFAFGGIEGIAAIADDVENPEKNVPKGLFLILSASTIFYLIFYYVFLGALGKQMVPSEGSKNIINPIVGMLFGNATILTIVITSIFIVSQVANKLSGRLQYGWVNTRFIAPLAVDGLLPLGLAKTNKYEQFKNAFWLDFLFTSGLVLIYILIAIFGPEVYKNNMSAMLQVYTLTAFVQYSITILACIKLSNYNKLLSKNPFSKAENSRIIKLKMWELFYFIFSVIIMIIFLCWYIVANISNMITDWSDNQGYIFQVGFFIFLIIVSTLTYFLSKYLRWPEKAAKVLAKKEKIYPEIEYIEKKMTHSSIFEDDPTRL